MIEKVETLHSFVCSYCGIRFSDKECCLLHEKDCIKKKQKESNFRPARCCHRCKHYISDGFFYECEKTGVSGCSNFVCDYYELLDC